MFICGVSHTQSSSVRCIVEVLDLRLDAGILGERWILGPVLPALQRIQQPTRFSLHAFPISRTQLPTHPQQYSLRAAALSQSNIDTQQGHHLHTFTIPPSSPTFPLPTLPPPSHPSSLSPLPSPRHADQVGDRVLRLLGQILRCRRPPPAWRAPGRPRRRTTASAPQWRRRREGGGADYGQSVVLPPTLPRSFSDRGHRRPNCRRPPRTRSG